MVFHFRIRWVKFFQFFQNQMTKMDNLIAIEFLDHVAFRVTDLDISVGWYQKVLVLKKYQLPE